jgi:phage terminase large subunit-like protein
MSSPFGQGGVGGMSSSMQDAQAASLLANWKMTPATMYAKLDSSWIAAKWLQYLSFKIAQAVQRGNCGLLLSAPPRHGKSKLSTIATPLWVLEHFPHKQVVVSTYGEELSTDFSREIRDLIANNQNDLSIRLRSDTRRVTNFMTQQGGGVKAVGLRGAITGRGADVFILDDYIKEPKEAMSATYLEDLWTWYRTVARTRLEPGAVVIILATRWVKNDIHGRIMEAQRKTGRNFFEYIEMPAVYEPMMASPELVDERGEPLRVPDYNATDIIGRHYGEVLFPQRFTRDSVYDLRTDLGSRWFEAMFQQNPLGDENAIINTAWFKKIPAVEFNRRLLDFVANKQRWVWARYWDMASVDEAGDYTSGALALYNKDTEDFYIRRLNRGQYSPARAELEFVKTILVDSKLEGFAKTGMEREPGSSGKYSIRHFEGLGREALPGFNLQEFPATNSKVLNAQPMLAAAENGQVYLVDDGDGSSADGTADWITDFLTEAEVFPEGAHDDTIDSISGAYKLATGKKGITASIGRVAEAVMEFDRLKMRQDSPEPEKKRRSSVTFGRNLVQKQLDFSQNRGTVGRLGQNTHVVGFKAERIKS